MKQFKIILFSSIIMFSSYIILLYTFLSAYLSPIKTVVVDINSVGEANIELVFLLISIPCVIYYLTRLKWSSKKGLIWFE